MSAFARLAFVAAFCLLATVVLSAPPGAPGQPGGVRDLGRQKIPQRPAENHEAPADTKEKAYLLIAMTPEEKGLLTQTAKADKTTVEKWARLTLLKAALKQQNKAKRAGK